MTPLCLLLLVLPAYSNRFSGSFSGFQKARKYTYYGRSQIRWLGKTMNQNTSIMDVHRSGGRNNPKPSTEVLDVTIRGPKKAQVAEYNKALSEFNPTSLSSLIRETKNRGISTGVTKEFRALYGTFGATPSLEGNLASTLEGEMSVEFLMYQSEQAARRIIQPPEKLAAEFPDIIQAFIELAPTLAGDDFYHIIVAKPEDQDFDVNSLIPEPNSVIWMQLADVKPGKQKQFLELREKLINKLASSPFITSFYKFDVKREATEGLGTSTNARTELLMYTAQSAEDQQAFIGGLFMEEPQFLMDFLSTYNCIACTALSGQLLPSYYPPFLVK